MYVVFMFLVKTEDRRAKRGMVFLGRGAAASPLATS